MNLLTVTYVLPKWIFVPRSHLPFPQALPLQALSIHIEPWCKLEHYASSGLTGPCKYKVWPDDDLFLWIGKAMANYWSLDLLGACSRASSCKTALSTPWVPALWLVWTHQPLLPWPVLSLPPGAPSSLCKFQLIFPDSGHVSCSCWHFVTFRGRGSDLFLEFPHGPLGWTLLIHQHISDQSWPSSRGSGTSVEGMGEMGNILQCIVPHHLS